MRVLRKISAILRKSVVASPWRRTATRQAGSRNGVKMQACLRAFLELIGWRAAGGARRGPLCPGPCHGRLLHFLPLAGNFCEKEAHLDRAEAAEGGQRLRACTGASAISGTAISADRQADLACHGCTQIRRQTSAAWGADVGQGVGERRLKGAGAE